MVDNPNKYSEMGTGVSLNDIRDDDDFPHAGIIKALSDGLGQNYAISGFAATNISATSVDIAAGKIMRDGKIVDVAGDTLTIGAGSGSTGNTYSILVAPASGAVIRIQGTVKNKTPNVPAGNTIIGVLVHTGSNPMQLQYLTVDKSENHLSIARDNSGTYTEVGALTGDANGITMTGLYKLDTLPTATIASADKIILQDTNDADKIKTATAQAIANLALTTTTATVATDDKVLIKDTNDADNLKTVTAQSIADLKVEADTLDTVTGRGNTTGNDITVGSIHSTVNQNISYEIVSSNASGQQTPVITGTKTVVYIETLASAGNTVALPAPASGNILYIINLEGAPNNITPSVGVINLGQAGHPKLSAQNVITLGPFEHITLQSVNDQIAPLQTGFMIISD